jgi:hypothetical protein
MRFLLELAYFNVDDFVHLACGMNRGMDNLWIDAGDEFDAASIRAPGRAPSETVRK